MEHVLQIPVTSITARIGAALRKRLEGTMTNEPPADISRLLSQLEKTPVDKEIQKNIGQTRSPHRS